MWKNSHMAAYTYTYPNAAFRRLSVIALFLVACAVFFLSHGGLQPSQPLRIVHLQGAAEDANAANTANTSTTAPATTISFDSEFDFAIKQFWPKLATALRDAAPSTPAIGVESGAPNVNITKFEPLKVDKTRAERLTLDEKNEKILMSQHYRMRTSAFALAKSLPFRPGTTGIVTTVNPKYMRIFLVSLRMVRNTGCVLPVEVFIGDWKEYDRDLCENVLPALNAQCVVQSDIYSKAKKMSAPVHFQFKIFAILFSSFQNVLFLDSDAFPAHDPTELFQQRPYTSHGLVVWPDIWANTVSSHYYHIAGIPEVPPSARYSSESGQLLLDKGMHRESLMMMVYYNYYGPSHYYPLLCQGSHGAGDKETFIHAAMAVELPWYQVRQAIQPLGRWNAKNFRFAGMGQVDPAEDFFYGRPMPNHVHNKDEWQTEDMTKPGTKAQKDLKAPAKPRPYFIHAMVRKYNPEHVLDDNDEDSPVKDVDGKFQRMWGPLPDMMPRFGYDIEKRLWHALVEVECGGKKEGSKCQGIKKYFKEVFGTLGEV